MNGLSWISIIRLGLVQTALGAIIIMTTTTLNRVMVVELALPATLPGLLVGIHHAVQMLRPRLGYGSDMGRRRTPWIIGGMAVLGAGGAVAAMGVALMGSLFVLGVVVAALGFFLVGLGSGAAGTSLLALVAALVAPQRRAPAATILWVMMIAGFAVTATTAGRFLDPFSPERLVAVTAIISLLAVCIATLAVRGVENSVAAPPAPQVVAAGPRPSFRAVLGEVWSDATARRFTIFVFVSMLAYNLSDLIIEPFAGQVFGMTIGQSTTLAGLQNAGTLAGMIVMAIFGSGVLGARLASLRGWMVGGCLGSGAMLVVLSATPEMEAAPLTLIYMGLGFATGAFAAAAIASMMQLAGAGRAGTRMGLWGAAQAIAFAIGGFAGAVLADIARAGLGSAAAGYGAVFLFQAGLFLVAAVLAARLTVAPRPLFPIPPLKEAVT
ncbi:MAG TPA: BCD family MFS transporter [Roseococcus sp.]|jgi:BCD family chlorophyll transporter-like MFS transporter|nr:BCD family MFS transporter [Roseococcus sp.]